MQWSDYNEPTQRSIMAIDQRLGEILTRPPTFDSLDQIDNLDHETAKKVIQAARRKLLFQLLSMETHEHWFDDCGDDLQIATENWAYLHDLYFGSDGDPETVIQGVKQWLDPRERNKEDDVHSFGGSDGEIRFDLLSEELINIHYDEQERLYQEWKAQK